MVKRPRTVWLDDETYKLLREQAAKDDVTKKAKGVLERYLTKIAWTAIIFLPKGKTISIKVDS